MKDAIWGKVLLKLRKVNGAAASRKKLFYRSIKHRKPKARIHFGWEFRGNHDYEAQCSI